MVTDGKAATARRSPRRRRSRSARRSPPRRRCTRRHRSPRTARPRRRAPRRTRAPITAVGCTPGGTTAARAMKPRQQRQQRFLRLVDDDPRRRVSRRLGKLRRDEDHARPGSTGATARTSRRRGNSKVAGRRAVERRHAAHADRRIADQPPPTASAIAAAVRAKSPSPPPVALFGRTSDHCVGGFVGGRVTPAGAAGRRSWLRALRSRDRTTPAWCASARRPCR